MSENKPLISTEEETKKEGKGCLGKVVILLAVALFVFMVMRAYRPNYTAEPSFETAISNDSFSQISSEESEAVSFSQEWITTCLAESNQYYLYADLPQELLDNMTSYGFPGEKSDISFFGDDCILVISAELTPHDSLFTSLYETMENDLNRAIDEYYRMTCDSVYEVAKEACRSYGLSVSESKTGNRTNFNTQWRTCTVTSTSNNDIEFFLENYFYMDDIVSVSVTLNTIKSKEAEDTVETQQFNQWVHTFQTTLDVVH